MSRTRGLIRSDEIAHEPPPLTWTAPAVEGEIRTFAFDFTPSGWARARANAAAGTVQDPTNAVWAASRNRYAAHAGAGMSTEAVAPTGADQPHNTMQPYLPLSVCIALVGEFPSHA